MHTLLVMRAMPGAELSAGSRAVRRFSAVRATAVRAPLSRTAFGASPARQAVVARDNVASLESYAGPPPLEVVPWTKEASNTVTLTGTVGSVDVRRLATGKTKANLRLAVRKTVPGDAEPETDWCVAPPERLARFSCLQVCCCGRMRRRCGSVRLRNCPQRQLLIGLRLGPRVAHRRFDVDVWNELAEQVAEHAPKGSKLVVSGKLVQEKCARARSLPAVVRADAPSSPLQVDGQGNRKAALLGPHHRLQRGHVGALSVCVSSLCLADLFAESSPLQQRVHG